MTATSVTRPTARSTSGLRLQLYIGIVLLAIEIALGMTVNLFAKLPASDRGTSLFTAFGAAVSSGPASLAIHAIVGTLIVLAATSVLIRAITSRSVAQIVLAVVGLLAVLMAWESGTGYVGERVAGASFGMALGTVIALLSYATALFLASRPVPAAA